MRTPITTRLSTAPAAPLLGFAAFVVLLGGCGAASPEPGPPPEPPPPIDADLAGLAPARADLVIRVDVAAIRDSSLSAVAQILAADPALDEFRQSTELEPLGVVDEVLLTARLLPDRREAVLVIVKGTFDAPATIEKLAAGGHGELLVAAGLNTLEGEEFYAVAITERTIVWGDKEQVARSLDLAGGMGRSLRDDEQQRDIDLANGELVRLRYRRGTEPPDLSRLRVRPLVKNVDQISGIDAWLKVGEELELRLLVEHADKVLASRMARDLERLRRRFARNTFVRLIGMEWLLERISVTSENLTVDIAARLAAEDVEKIQRLAERLRQIRELSADSGADDEPLEKPDPKFSGEGDDRTKTMKFRFEWKSE